MVTTTCTTLTLTLGTFSHAAIVAWFAIPTYPDNDPLLTVIDVNGPPASEPNIVCLKDIDPARVCFFVDRSRECMCMMRIEGIDISPDL